MEFCAPPVRRDGGGSAVWEGESGTTAADALAACGDDSVAAAYALDAQTGAWSRWLQGKPGVSNLPSLGEVQGLLALGAAPTADAFGESYADAQPLGEEKSTHERR